MNAPRGSAISSGQNARVWTSRWRERWERTKGSPMAWSRWPWLRKPSWAPARWSAARPTSRASPGGWTRNALSSPARDHPSMRRSPKRSSTGRMPDRGADAGSDLPVQPAVEGGDPGVDALPVRLDEPQRRGDRGEQRIAVLGGEAEAVDLALVTHGERRRDQHGLRQDAAVVAVVAAEAEDQVGVALVRRGHQGVVPQALLDLVQRDVAVEVEAEPDRVHVLGVELDGARKQVQVQVQRLEDVVGVAGVVGAEVGVVVLADVGGRHVAVRLRDVVRPPHADEGAPLQAEVPAAVVADGLDQGRDVVGVAGDDLDEAVLAGHQDLLIDAAGVGLAEAELAPLGEEALGAGQVLVHLLLVLVAGPRAVDDHGGPLQGFLGLETHLVPQLLELLPHVLVDRQLGATPDEV